jgi:hypothetical protein
MTATTTATRAGLEGLRHRLRFADVVSVGTTST